jgi:hypothetical protein
MRRVLAFLRRHLLMILGALALLAAVVVLWIFSALIGQWLRSTQSVDAVTFLREHLLAAAILGGGLLILALIIWVPKRQASRVQDVKDRLTVENAARQTLAQIVGGAVLIAGLFFTWANLRITQQTATTSQATATKNLELTREGQITDRFTKAIAQLGEQGPEKLAVRLGGIYALERIARDSEKDHWPIMEVLTAYVRENAPWRPKPPKDTPPQQDNPCPKGDPAAAQGQPPPKLATDIQAILTVLGRRDRTHEMEDQHLDLRETDLRAANLKYAHLEGAYLMHAHLEGAILHQAHLMAADLMHAHLQGAGLGGADLDVAILWQAHLDGAILEGASLLGAGAFG